MEKTGNNEKAITGSAGISMPEQQSPRGISIKAGQCFSACNYAEQSDEQLLKLIRFS